MVAKPSTLNDPFEFLYRNTGAMTISKARKYIKSKKQSDFFYNEIKRNDPNVKNRKDFKRLMNEKLEELAKNYLQRFETITECNPDFARNIADTSFRISCFSKEDIEPSDQILMWSHYADKHSGIRIKFSLDETRKHPYFLKVVNYRKERVAIDLTNGAETEAVKNALMEAAATKSDAWRHEKEVRMFVLSDQCKDETDLVGVTRSFKSFDPSIVKGIDFGIRCPQHEITRIVELAKHKYPRVELRRAIHHRSAFAIEYKII
jgi:hypothetical protein